MTATKRYLVVGLAVGLAATVAVVVMRRTHEPSKASPPPIDERAKAVRDYRAHASTSHPSAAIGGTVVDETGTAVQGAAVCAFAIVGEELATDAEPACTTTGADGGYVVGGLTAGSLRVTATMDEYGPASFPGAAGDGLLTLGPAEQRAGVDIVLRTRGGAVVVGTVNDALGGVIQQARVFVANGASTVATQTDANGAFRVRTLPGAITVAVDADGYAPTRVGASAPSNDLVIALAPESVLVGRVVASDDSPVAGARVFASPSDGTAAVERSSVSGPDGRFVIAGLLPGRYRPSSRHQAMYGVADRSVVLAIGETSEAVTIRMRAGATVVGQVVAATNGAPCAGAQVLIAHPPANRRYSAVTNSEGTVVFEGVVPAAYQVTVLCEGASSVDSIEPIDVALDDASVHVWKVDRARTLGGRVETRAGEPVNGVLVAAVAGEGPRAGQVVATNATGSDGRFSLSGLAAGDYLVAVETADHAPPAEPLPVTLEPGVDREDLRIVVQPGRVVRGTVRFADGAAAVGVQVRVSDELERIRATSVDETGAFALDALGYGPLQLELLDARLRGVPVRASGDPHSRDAYAIAASDATTTLALIAAPSDEGIRGRVVDPQGNGIADAWVACARERAGDDGAHASPARDPAVERVMTAQDGSFALAGLAPGSYTLHALRPGGGEVIQRGVSAGSEVELVLRLARSISGKVEVVGGSSPPDQFRIELRSRQRTLGEPFFGSGGAWVIEGVHPGRYDLSVYASEGSATLEIEVPADRDLDNLILRISAGAIEGRVVDATSGSAVEGCRVLARAAGGGSWVGSDLSARHNITDGSGKFALSGVPGGPLQLWIAPESDDCAAYGNTLAAAYVDPGGTASVADIEIHRRQEDAGKQGSLGFSASLDPNFLLRVTEVRAAGPADRAGLRVDDVIVSIGDHDLRTTRTYSPSLLLVPAGVAVRLELASGEALTIVAAPGSS